MHLTLYGLLEKAKASHLLVLNYTFISETIKSGLNKLKDGSICGT